MRRYTFGIVVVITIGTRHIAAGSAADPTIADPVSASVAFHGLTTH
jgi:hypothetical protein